jgi:hypothetical protein
MSILNAGDGTAFNKRAWLFCHGKQTFSFVVSAGTLHKVNEIAFSQDTCSARRTLTSAKRGAFYGVSLTTAVFLSYGYCTPSVWIGSKRLKKLSRVARNSASYYLFEDVKTIVLFVLLSP